MTATILVSRTRLWSRATPWGFHCRTCHTAMTGYPSSAADEGRGHWARVHRCCELHDEEQACGLQDWCCYRCPELAEVRGYIDGTADKEIA
jgi:hypothetical protein